MPDERVEIAGERVDAVIRRRDVGAVEAALVVGDAFKALGDNCGNLKLPDAEPTLPPWIKRTDSPAPQAE
jgi:hypothetical protein